MKSESRRLILVSLLCALVLLPACATVGKESDPAGSLSTIAAEYWKMRMEDKYEKTYAMEDREGLPPFEEYRNRVMAMKRIYIVSHRIKDVKTEGSGGTVEVEFSFLLAQTTKPFHQIVTDLWIYRGGEWRHRFSPN